MQNSRPQAAPENGGGATATAPATSNSTGQTPAELVDAIAHAKARIGAGDLDGGLSAFREIAERHPSIPEVFNNLGAICAAVGQREEAEFAFGRAIQLTPDSPNPWYNRGLMRFQGGNNLGAQEDFERAVALDPEDPEFQNNLGVAHFQLQEWPQARACFEEALRLRSDYVAAQLNMVDVDMAENDLDGAHARVRAIAARNDDPDIQLKLIECSVQAAVDALQSAKEDCKVVTRAEAPPVAVVDQQERIERAQEVLRGDVTSK